MRRLLALVALVQVLCLNFGNVENLKILGVFAMPSGSHYILGSSLMRELAERGHDVTFISSFAMKDPPKKGKYRDIVITGMVERMEEQRVQMNFFDMETSNRFISMFFMNFMSVDLTAFTLAHENVQKLINSGEKFDLVLVEEFKNHAQKALAQHFGAPLVVLSSMGQTSWVNHFVRNPSPLSYIPEIMVDTEGPRMSYLERVKNTAMHVYLLALNHIHTYPAHRKLIQKHIPSNPSIEGALYNVSLLLVNGHNSLNPPTPSVPAMVSIGGYHIKPPKKLPKDLQEFLDGSPDGVVYFSMGSNLRSTELPVEKREAFLKTFAKLKQKVLWKWEDDSLPGQPPNVKLGKWLPQQDILAHPNVKLFITHGGFLSTTETIYHGVPVLSIPIFGDQQLNSQLAVQAGYGLTVTYSEVTEEKLSKSIKELLSNPKYTNSAKTKSRLFHDRPMKPMDTAIYWLEYVVRNGGAPHLRVAGMDLPWYQYYLLDVATLFIAVGLVLLYVNFLVTRAVLRAVCRRLCKSTTSKVQEEKDKAKKKQ